MQERKPLNFPLTFERLRQLIRLYYNGEMRFHFSAKKKNRESIEGRWSWKGEKRRGKKDKRELAHYMKKKQFSPMS